MIAARIAAHTAPPATRSWSPIFVLRTALLALVAALLQARNFGTTVWDFYPLLYGAKAWLATGDAYALPAPPPPFPALSIYQAGNPYPLPAVFLTLPVAPLDPRTVATIIAAVAVVAIATTLRLAGMSPWFLFYYPVINAFDVQNWTLLLLPVQILALWAHRERRWWLLAGCGAVLLTKPNHAAFFVLALTLLGRNWWRQAAAIAVLWGGTLLVSPAWPVHWVHALLRYRQMTSDQPILWALGLAALPLLWARRWIAAATVAQFAILPFPVPLGIYPAVAVPLTVLARPVSRWLIAASWLQPLMRYLFGPAWGTCVALIAPTVAVILWDHYRCAHP